jgi:hypothetical protein
MFGMLGNIMVIFVKMVVWNRYLKQPRLLMNKGTNGCMYNCGDSCTRECMEPKIEEPKQETLEEVAERIYPINNTGNQWMPTKHDLIKANKQIGFIEGAKWAQEEIKQFLYAEICERRPYTSSKMCEEVIKYIEQMDKQQEQ